MQRHLHLKRFRHIIGIHHGTFPRVLHCIRFSLWEPVYLQILASSTHPLPRSQLLQRTPKSCRHRNQTWHRAAHHSRAQSYSKSVIRMTPHLSEVKLISVRGSLLFLRIWHGHSLPRNHQILASDGALWNKSTVRIKAFSLQIAY